MKTTIQTFWVWCGMFPCEEHHCSNYAPSQIILLYTIENTFVMTVKLLWRISFYRFNARTQIYSSRCSRTYPPKTSKKNPKNFIQQPAMSQCKLHRKNIYCILHSKIFRSPLICMNCIEGEFYILNNDSLLFHSVLDMFLSCMHAFNKNTDGLWIFILFCFLTCASTAMDKLCARHFCFHNKF